MSGLSSNGSQRTDIFTPSGSFATAASKLRLATKHQGQMASETISTMRDVLLFASQTREGLVSVSQLASPQTAPCARSFISNLLCDGLRLDEQYGRRVSLSQVVTFW